MTFALIPPGRVFFGVDQAQRIPDLVASVGRRPLVVTGSRTAVAAAYFPQAPTYSVAGEPFIDDAVSAAIVAVEHDCDVLVGFGGGSAIDVAKAAAALATNRKDVFTYLEVIGKGNPLVRPPLPVVAVPTTAGTGSEVTKNAVLASRSHRVKVSLRDPAMVPAVAVVDPRLTASMPPAVTAATGMDALAQLAEAFVSAKANWYTDALCREGLVHVCRYIERAWRDGDDIDARSHMSFGALLSGMALANGGLGAVHGIAGPAGGLCAAAHGALCAALLPAVFAFHARRAPDAVRSRCDEVARIVTGDPDATAERGAAWLAELAQRLEIPRLGKLGLRAEDVDTLCSRSLESSSMKANPYPLDRDDVARIVQDAW